MTNEQKGTTKDTQRTLAQIRELTGWKRAAAAVLIYIIAVSLLSLVFTANWAAFVLPASAMALSQLLNNDTIAWLEPSVKAVLLILSTQLKKLTSKD